MSSKRVKTIEFCLPVVLHSSIISYLCLDDNHICWSVSKLWRNIVERPTSSPDSIELQDTSTPFVGLQPRRLTVFPLKRPMDWNITPEPRLEANRNATRLRLLCQSMRRRLQSIELCRGSLPWAEPFAGILCPLEQLQTLNIHSRWEEVFNVLHNVSKIKQLQTLRIRIVGELPQTEFLRFPWHESLVSFTYTTEHEAYGRLIMYSEEEFKQLPRGLQTLSIPCHIGQNATKHLPLSLTTLQCSFIGLDETSPSLSSLQSIHLTKSIPSIVLFFLFFSLFGLIPFCVFFCL